MMTNVMPDQFELVSDLEILHRPTGARISTYRYENPADACSTVTINWGRAVEVLESGEDFNQDDIKRVACTMLRKKALESSS